VTAPRTYRFRLVFYIGALLLFMVAALVLSYHSSNNLVLKEAENNAARLVQQIEGQLMIEARDLAERAKMMRDNTGFTGYLYIAISLGTDPGAMAEIYKRQFGWLQIDRSIILSRSGKALIGVKHSDLRTALIKRRLLKDSEDHQFYHDGQRGLEMVATSPISYRSQMLGVIAITRTLDADWMKVVRQMSGGQLFLVKDGRIVLSTIGDANGDQSFKPSGDRVGINGESYLVRRVATGDDAHLPQLWFALSQKELTAYLHEQRNRMLVLVIAGCLGGLIIGFMMLRNFSAPLGRLVKLTEEVGAGRLPEINRGPSHDEIGYLTNRFSEMVTSLREQKDEVKRVQTQLEHEATTDALTGFYNRRYLYNIFPKLWSEAIRNKKNQTLIIVDIDHFTTVNDRYGHQVGDCVLLHFARVLRDNCRVSDFIFRLGGEEFLVLTSGDSEGGMYVAEKIRAALEYSVYTDGERVIPATASFGVAQADTVSGMDDLSRMLQRADKALYSAKTGGRNRVVVWYPQRESA
jgi:diguanylate cyclase (GGDEF)-like protein